jgi:hypothetical protein
MFSVASWADCSGRRLVRNKAAVIKRPLLKEQQTKKSSSIPGPPWSQGSHAVEIKN